jgi:hypothetical protein
MKLKSKQIEKNTSVNTSEKEITNSINSTYIPFKTWHEDLAFN